jgi:hypothetical protein
MADQMMGSQRSSLVPEQVDDAAREPAREDAALPAFVQQKEPALKQTNAADVRHWQGSTGAPSSTRLARAVRPYSPTRRSSGVIDTVGRLSTCRSSR